MQLSHPDSQLNIQCSRHAEPFGSSFPISNHDALIAQYPNYHQHSILQSSTIQQYLRLHPAWNWIVPRMDHAPSFHHDPRRRSSNNLTGNDRVLDIRNYAVIYGPISSFFFCQSLGYCSSFDFRSLRNIHCDLKDGTLLLCGL